MGFILIALQTNNTSKAFMLGCGEEFVNLGFTNIARVMIRISVVFQFLLGREILATHSAPVFVMTHQVGQILLLSNEELPTPLTSVLSVALMFLGVLLHLLLVLKDLTALQADHLAAHGVLGVMCPQAGLLYKLPGAKLAVIILFCSRNIVDCLQVRHQESPLGKLSIALGAVVVVVTQTVLVQLECCQKCFGALRTFVYLLFGCLVATRYSCLWLCTGLRCFLLGWGWWWGRLSLGLVVLDALARVVVQGEDLLVADLTPAPDAGEWLGMAYKLLHVESFPAENTGGAGGVVADGGALLLSLRVQV